MPSLKSICADLDRIDWNFPGAGGGSKTVHSAHWFPGNFIPQIPSHLIQILSKRGDIVLDPFGGSGTTALEAVRLGRNAISSDIVSACILISEAKFASYRYPIDKKTRFNLLTDLTWTYLCETDSIGRGGEGSNPELNYWYSPRTLRQLRFLWRFLEQFSFPERASLELVFSDVLFACASPGKSMTSTGNVRRHHWGWVADNVRPREPKDHDAIALFRQRLIELPENGADTDADLSCSVVQQNAKRLAIKNSSIDLIVTSPPYVGVIDYTRANRLLYMWKGWRLEFDQDRECEIGARYKRSRKDIQAQYLSEMQDCWNEFKRVLKPQSYCVVVIGESRRFPGTAEMALKNYEKIMPVIWGPVARYPSRRRVADRSATDCAEFVCVFQKT